MVQIFAGVGISLFVIIATVLIYKNQNKKDSIYDKVTKLIENVHVRKMINILIISTVVIIDILLISLVLSMFLPSVEWGWIDRNTLITTIATIMGGFFGFIGAAVGIIGTYGAFYLGVKKEKDKEDGDRKNIKKFELEILQKLIEYTLEETNLLSSILVDKYIDFHKDKGCLEILQYRCYENNVVFYWMIEELIIKNTTLEMRENTRDYLNFKGIYKYNDNELYKKVKSISRNDLESLYYSIQGLFTENYNFKKIVYTDDWHKYMLNLREKENYSYTSIKDIINWITFLDSNIIEECNKRIHRLEEDKLRLDSNTKLACIEAIDKEIKDIKKNQVTNIMKFIEYRDNVIDVLESLFTDYEIEYDIVSSNDYIYDKIDFKSWKSNLKTSKS